MHIVHIAAHVGGGVYRALSGLWRAMDELGARHRRTLVLCDRPDHPASLDAFSARGVEVVVQPEPGALRAVLRDADLVQLEYWNHPTLLATLAAWNGDPAARVVVWHHQNGLHNPVLPAGFIERCHAFVQTSPCAFAAPAVERLSVAARARVQHAWSCGGLDDLPVRPKQARGLRAGYFGSLQFAKLHPRFIDFCAAVAPFVEGPIILVGEPVNRDALLAQAAAKGLSDRLHFAGHSTEIHRALHELDVLLYILNPTHYGTTENALLDAMACGVVPIVLDHGCERGIVRDGQTGHVVRDPQGAGRAVEELARNPGAWEAMSEAASVDVRRRFEPQASAEVFQGIYHRVLGETPRVIPWTDVVGPGPAAWFLATQGAAECFLPDGAVSRPPSSDLWWGMLERTKGSVFQFAAAFPSEPLLGRWASALSGLGDVH